MEKYYIKANIAKIKKSRSEVFRTGFRFKLGSDLLSR